MFLKNKSKKERTQVFTEYPLYARPEGYCQAGKTGMWMKHSTWKNNDNHSNNSTKGELWKWGGLLLGHVWILVNRPFSTPPQPNLSSPMAQSLVWNLQEVQAGRKLMVSKSTVQTSPYGGDKGEDPPQKQEQCTGLLSLHPMYFLVLCFQQFPSFSHFFKDQTFLSFLCLKKLIFK